jgi:hypothetical protein
VYSPILKTAKNPIVVGTIGSMLILKDCCKEAGTGFLSGQGLAAISAFVHAMRYAPAGGRTSDFVQRFRRNSAGNGIEMASWGMLNAIFQPLLQHSISDERARRAVSGGIVGSLMAVRNGKGHMIKSGMSGLVSAIVMDYVANCVGFLLQPFDSETLQPDFFSEISAASFGRNPLELVHEVFLKDRSV